MSNNDFVMPSSPSDRIKIKQALDEASNSMTRREAEQDFMKDLKAKMKEEFGIPVKVFGRMAKVHHNRNFNETVSGDNAFAELYQEVVGEAVAHDDEDDEE